MVLILYTFFLLCLGDPAKLHIQIRDFNVDMQSLEKLSLQELQALCEKCGIPVTSNKSQVFALFNEYIFFSWKCDEPFISGSIVIDSKI